MIKQAKDKMERRLNGKAGSVSLRMAGDDKESNGTAFGVAAVFFNEDDRAGTQYRLWDNVFERIMPGAFDESLANGDVRALWNHNHDHVLGRTSAGTLRLSVDAVGLHYEIEPGETQSHRDLVERLNRGDVDGSSFGFFPTEVQWSTETAAVDGNEVELDIRSIYGVELLEVSPVAWPAYTGTTSGVRMRSFGTPEEARADYEQWAGSAAAKKYANERFNERQMRDRQLRELQLAIHKQR